MKTLYSVLTLILFFTAGQNKGISQIHPTFDMSIRNITTVPDPVTGADSLMIFDLFIIWTNASQPGVNTFEYAGAQHNITFNPALGNSTNLAVSKIEINGGINFPQSLQSPTMRISPFPGADGRTLLQTSVPFPDPTINFIISSTEPGNRMMRLKIRTTAHIWPVVPPNFRFQVATPNNTFPGYFLPSADPKDPDHQLIEALYDTIVNHYIVNENFPLPVELASFSSSVNKNTVALSWSTSSETNNQGFDVERALIGSNDWTKAGFINGNGTTNETKNYTFTERVQTPGAYVYRLKQIDYNGNFEYHNLSNEVIVGIPSTYSLSQNYPNPFNPSTKIDFELPYDGKVSILLYDVSGREVGKLVNEVKTAGYYTVDFNASNLSSGMYFYRITAGQTFVQTKKMILLK